MNTEWIDAKYVSLLAYKLRNFKKQGTNKWNFSCPLCGDSVRHKRKARGYVFPHKGSLLFKCHNCGVSLPIPALLKNVDGMLYSDYLKEKLVLDKEYVIDSVPVQIKIVQPKPKKKENPLDSLRKISQLKPESNVKQYIMDRCIPSKYHYKLFYCRRFKEWVNTLIPNKFETLDHDEPRLIIPFLDKEGNLFGFQGRSFDKDSKLRYITIMLDDEHPKVFGLDTLQSDKKFIYVLEGPIDSMFVDNAIAVAGSDISTGIIPLGFELDRFVLVYDNEPRNKEIVSKMENAVSKGFMVCIWPDSIKQKDVNDMVMSGMSPSDVLDVINQNVYTGLKATLRLSQWKRV